MNDRYTVWIGGIEVNDFLMSKGAAIERANLYRQLGYTDVHIEKYYNIPPQLKSYLWQEFHKNNIPKYYKYFEDWLSKLTPVQIDYFIAYSKNQKTPFYTYNDRRYCKL